MALLDVSDVLDDPDFTSAFDLYVDASTFVDGITQSAKTPHLGMIGVVQPAGAKALDALPDGARRSGAVEVWTTTRLSVGDQTRDADEIVWQGSRYRVTSVTDWTSHGVGWVRATCVLMQVNPTP